MGTAMIIDIVNVVHVESDSTHEAPDQDSGSALVNEYVIAPQIVNSPCRFG